MLTNLFYLLILLMGVLAGYLISYLCKDEIKNWRRRLFFMVVIFLVLAIVILFIDFEYKLPVVISLFFIIIVFSTIIWRKFNK